MGFRLGRIVGSLERRRAQGDFVQQFLAGTGYVEATDGFHLHALASILIEIARDD